MNNVIKVSTYSHYATALAYGDYSGLSDQEKNEVLQIEKDIKAGGYDYYCSGLDIGYGMPDYPSGGLYGDLIELLLVENDSLQEFIVKTLPHGSGIDCKWNIDKNGDKITARNSWHCMNNNGYYCGYVEFYCVFHVENNLIFFDSIHAENWKYNRYKIEKYWKQLQIKDYVEEIIYYHVNGKAAL